jgi:hypothetical protein
MNKSKNNIDTGKLINNFLINNRITRAEVGRDINRSGLSVLKYIQNSSIQTGILIDISFAVKHNFFQDIANALPQDFSKNEIIDTQKIAQDKSIQEQLAILEKENMVLKIQNELLMKIKV